MERVLSYTFAIIGGGLTATSMLCQLVDKLERLGRAGRQFSQGLSIVVFEKKDVLGPGLPHNHRYVLPFHITNMCAHNMSVRYEKPGDFQDWVQNNLASLQERYPELITVSSAPEGSGKPCRHYPRAVMGEYLTSRFDDAVESARQLAISVELRANCEVIDLFDEDKRIHLTINESQDTEPTTSRVDGVLLATGHWFQPFETRKYFSSPWPASKLLEGIPAAERVAVIGSSLSAIEVALTLTADGQFVRQGSGELRYLPSVRSRNIVFYSRHGLLPRVRGRLGRRENRYLKCDAIRQLIADSPYRLTLSMVFELLDRELTAAYGCAFNWQQLINPPAESMQRLGQDIQDAQLGDGPAGELLWQTVLSEIFPVARDIYSHLTLAERERFDLHFNTLFFIHAACQPLINAEKMLALMRAGFLSLVKLGGTYRFECDNSTDAFQFIYNDPDGNLHNDSYQYVVNARGQSRFVETDPAPLIRNLLRRAHIQIEETRRTDQAVYTYKSGSIVIDPQTHLVVPPNIDPPSLSGLLLFAVGAMTRGQIIDASMAHGIARSTATVADHLITRLGSFGDR